MMSDMNDMKLPLIIPTQVYYNSICLPDVAKLAKEASSASAALQGMIDQVMGVGQIVSDDLKNAGWVVGVCILVALFVGLFYMCFLRVFAGLLVFITIVAYLLGLVALGSMMMAESKELGDDGSS